MPDEPAPRQGGEKTKRPSRAAIGCLLLPGSFFGGGMIAVGVAQIVDQVRGCTAAADMPACNTFEFFFTGAILGVIVVLVLVQWRLGRRRDGQARDQLPRG